MTAPIIVVGAGPAGSLAALVLARAGCEVTLIDRATFPRPKLCGDTVNPGTLALLDRLGVGQTVRARSRRITGMLVTGPRGAVVAADYPEGVYGAAIERRDLDQVLVDAAVRAGARFLSGSRVDTPLLNPTTGRVEGVRGEPGRVGEMKSTLVIAADGRASRLGGALGLTRFASSPQRWAFGAYYAGVADVTSHGEMHIRPDGYLGIAPVSTGFANVCMVRELDAAVHNRREDAVATITAAIEADPPLRQRFAKAHRVSDAVVLGPLAVEATAAGCPGLVLAGDAAGFVDPMTGDGLRFAVEGGMLAAEASLHEIATGEPAFVWLSHARSRAFAGKWRLNRALRWIVGSRAALDAAARAGTQWPFAIRTLVSAAGDVRLV